MEALTAVCMATYTCERHVAGQLASSLQSPRVVEVPASDDGSTDRTREIALGFADARVRLLDGPRAWAIGRFESLLGAASGDFNFLADRGYMWLPDKVIAIPATPRTANLLVSDCSVVKGELRLPQASFQALRQSCAGLLKNLVRNGALGCCMGFRPRVLDRAPSLPRRVPMLSWWIGLVTECGGSVRFQREPLLSCRRAAHHAMNKTVNLVSDDDPLLMKCGRPAVCGGWRAACSITWPRCTSLHCTSSTGPSARPMAWARPTTCS